MFLLVLAHLLGPGQNLDNRKMVVVCNSDVLELDPDYYISIQ